MQREKARILLVEDNEAHAGLIRRAFEARGRTELTTAATLKEARARLGKFLPDLVVADLMLPDGKGTELLSRHENEPHIPVVVMTSFGNEQAAVEAMKAGALDYLVKSAATLADIPRVVERALREWQQILGRRQAESQLQEERNRAQQYLNIAAVILLVLDKAGKITLLNRKGHEVLGYREEELVGCNWFDTCLPQRIRSEVRSAFEQSVAGDLARIEHHENLVMTKSGEERTISWHNTLLKDEAGAITATLSSGEDITERKRAEEALARSEERWRSLVENAPNVVMTAERDGTITFISHTVPVVNPEEVVGRCIRDFFPAEFHNVVMDSIEEVFRTNGPSAYEARVTEEYGSLWFDNQVGPVRKHGEVVAATIIATDITERKRMEEALQEAQRELEKKVEERTAELRDSEAKFRAYFTGSGQGMAVRRITDDGLDETIDVNDTLLNMLGYSREEFLGLPLSEILTQEERGLVPSRAAEVREKGSLAFELDFVAKDGRTIPSVCHLSIVDIPEDPLVIASVIDITERKEAERSLLESEKKFRTLFESSSDAVMLLDEKGFFDCNDPTLQIFGCSSREEFIGKHPSELSPLMQRDGTDSLTAAKAKITLAVQSGTANFEWIHRRIDGTEFEADVLLSSMDLNGKTVLQAVVRDISKRKRAEEAVLREQARLRRLLESSDRDRKLTAYEIHDGLAQHITGAKMQFEAALHLKDKYPEAEAAAYERGLELLIRGMDESRRLISGLRPPILDEAGVVAAIEHLTRDPTMQEGPEIGFVFNVQFGRLEPLLENAIFRIVQESVTNACRHSDTSKVQVRLTQENGRIHIEIEDWGIGFDQDDIAETSFGIGGVRERARLLGGQATIDSAPGQGTRILVDLPLVRNS